MNSRLHVGSVLVAVAAAFMLSIRASAPPPALPDSAPAEVFSAQRAMEHVRVIANNPRPIDSPAHTASREYLLGELQRLGLEVELQRATIVEKTGPGRFVAARVTNVLGRKAGSGDEGAVLFVSHYDTRPQTYGAADAASGVAAILETLRALESGPPLARDLIVAITDGEEMGLFGARAFIEQHRWAQEVELVLNFEARGNRGPAILFGTSPGGLELMRTAAAAIRHPSANSLACEIYRRIPNDSDFSVFSGAGISGFVFAFIGNHAAYHTLLDAAERLDTGSLQHLGSHALALIRGFAGSRSLPTGEREAVYFSLLNRWLYVYSATAAQRLGLALLAAAALALALTWRRGAWSSSGLLRGAGYTVASTVGGGMAGVVPWWVLETQIPAVLAAPHGRPYRTLWFGAALLLATVAIAAWLAGACKGERGRMDLLAGVLLFWAVAAAALSFWIPGASFLLTWPALAGWIGWLAAATISKPPALRWWLSAAGGLVAVLLIAPMLLLSLQALTLSGSAAPAAVAGLLCTLLTPQLAAANEGPRPLLSWFAGGGSIALFVAALLVPLGDAPRPDSLSYLQTPSESLWLTFADRPSPWTGQFLGDTDEYRDTPDLFPTNKNRLLTSAAPPLNLTAPSVEGEEIDGNVGRRIRVQVASRRGGQMLQLQVESLVPVTALTIGGERFEVANPPGSARLTLIGLSTEEAWKLEVESAQRQPLELLVMDQRWGLPDELTHQARPRSRDEIPSSSWWTDATFAVREATL